MRVRNFGWVFAPCVLVQIYGRFIRAIITLVVEAASTSETY
jgi:hypothetical protein